MHEYDEDVLELDSASGQNSPERVPLYIICNYIDLQPMTIYYTGVIHKMAKLSKVVFCEALQ